MNKKEIKEIEKSFKKWVKAKEGDLVFIKCPKDANTAHMKHHFNPIIEGLGICVIWVDHGYDVEVLRGKYENP